MLSFLPIPWDSAFKWVYVSFSPLPFASFLFRAIYKAFSDNHFAFLHFFFEVRDSGRECQAAIAQEQPREATPHLRLGVAAGRSNPTSKEQWLHGCRRAYRSYPTLKVRNGGGKEIPLVQGKEQRLCFAGAAM